MKNPTRTTRRERQNIWIAIFRALRPHQWIKNALVFVPLVLGGLLLEFDAWSYAFLGFVALCLAASASYVLNDLRDAQSDRKHPNHLSLENGSDKGSPPDTTTS